MKVQMLNNNKMNVVRCFCWPDCFAYRYLMEVTPHGGVVAGVMTQVAEAARVVVLMIFQRLPRGLNVIKKAITKTFLSALALYVTIYRLY